MLPSRMITTSRPERGVWGAKRAVTLVSRASADHRVRFNRRQIFAEAKRQGLKLADFSSAQLMRYMMCVLAETMISPLPKAVRRCTGRAAKPFLKRRIRRARFNRDEIVDELYRQGIRLPDFMSAQLARFFACVAKNMLRQSLPRAVSTCAGQKLIAMSHPRFRGRSPLRRSIFS